MQSIGKQIVCLSVADSAKQIAQRRAAQTQAKLRVNAWKNHAVPQLLRIHIFCVLSTWL
jgi:hypothetical protein